LKTSIPKDYQTQPKGLKAKSIIRALVTQVITKISVIKAAIQDGPYNNKQLKELI